MRGDMAINFSCAPENAGRLVDLALDEVEALQAAGPSTEEVSNLQHSNTSGALIQQNATLLLPPVLRWQDLKLGWRDLDLEGLGCGSCGMRRHCLWLMSPLHMLPCR